MDVYRFTGQDLSTLIDIADHLAHGRFTDVRIGFDTDGVKFSVNRQTWTPGYGTKEEPAHTDYLRQIRAEDAEVNRLRETASKYRRATTAGSVIKRLEILGKLEHVMTIDEQIETERIRNAWNDWLTKPPSAANKPQLTAEELKWLEGMVYTLSIRASEQDSNR